MNKTLYKLLFAAFFTALILCACKNNVQPDNSLQITKDDVIHLDGAFNDNFLENWEYILLEDDTPEAMLGYVDGLFYDDGLFFVFSDKYSNHASIKVFDSTGHYQHDIGQTGRARNEYIHPIDWAINTWCNEIIVMDNTSFNKRYSYKGEFLGEAKRQSGGINDGYIGGDILKCMSDGTMMYYCGLCILPSFDYYMAYPDGNLGSPFKMTDYHAYCEMDPIEYVRLAGDIGGVTLTSVFANVKSDTTWLLRLLDNHIYKVSDDTAQCVANMKFLPEIPYKTKCNYDYENDNKYKGQCIPNYFYDMKDYLYIWYYSGGEYLFDKASSKMYHMEYDSLDVSIPDIGFPYVYDNSIIGCVDTWSIQKALKLIDSKDYDHRYSPEVEAFYRKVKDCENPPIIIAHYRKKQ